MARSIGCTKNIRNKISLPLSLKSRCSVIVKNVQIKNRNFQRLNFELQSLWYDSFIPLNFAFDLRKIHSCSNIASVVDQLSPSRNGRERPKLTDKSCHTNDYTQLLHTTGSVCVHIHHRIIPHQWANYSFWRVCVHTFELKPLKCGNVHSFYTVVSFAIETLNATIHLVSTDIAIVRYHIQIHMEILWKQRQRLPFCWRSLKFTDNFHSQEA